MPDSPVFVLVHGAFMDGSAWDRVAASLEAGGHRAVVAELPGRGAPAGTQVSLDAYRDAVLAVVRAQDGPVVLVGHSFGGIVISAVAEAAPEAVRRLVYVAAYLPQSGQSLDALSKEDTGTHFTQENFVLAPDYSYAEVLNRDRVDLFCADCSADEQALVRTSLVREPLGPLGEGPTLTEARFGSVPKAYVKTLRDHAASPAIQALMLERTPVEAVYEIDTSHAPFLTQPAVLADLLVEASR